MNITYETTDVRLKAGSAAHRLRHHNQRCIRERQNIFRNAMLFTVHLTAISEFCCQLNGCYFPVAVPSGACPLHAYEAVHWLNVAFDGFVWNVKSSGNIHRAHGIVLFHAWQYGLPYAGDSLFFPGTAESIEYFTLGILRSPLGTFPIYQGHFCLHWGHSDLSGTFLSPLWTFPVLSGTFSLGILLTEVSVQCTKHQFHFRMPAESRCSNKSSCRTTQAAVKNPDVFVWNSAGTILGFNWFQLVLGRLLTAMALSIMLRENPKRHF